MTETHPHIIETLETTTVGKSTIATADRRVHLALDAQEAVLLRQLDGSLSTDEVRERFGPAGSEVLAELRAAGMLVGSTPPEEPSFALTSAGLEFAGFDRVVALCNRLIGTLLSQPFFLLVSALVAVTGLVTVLLRPLPTGPRFSASVTLAALLSLMLIAGFVHETAHALVIHRGGRRVGRAGFGLYWGEISFFVDATDAYFLPKRQRIIQTMAGPATDAVLTGALGIAAHTLLDGPWAVLLHQAAITGWLVVVINVAPVMKLDGYWALADLLQAADLHGEMGDALRSLRNAQRDGRTVVLGLYAVASGLSGVVLLTSSVAAWMTYYGPLVADAWSSGVVGACLAVAFIGPSAAGLVAAAWHGVRRIRRTNSDSNARRRCKNHETSNPPHQQGPASAVATTDTDASAE